LQFVPTSNSGEARVIPALDKVFVDKPMQFSL
jgi:hypothetical protein